MLIDKTFEDFPNEADHIGRLYAGYTELEFSLMHCVIVVRDDFDTILKAMFRTRGEAPRINVADAFGRQAYDTLNLGTQFALGITAINHCRKIRNQYAHCVWWDDNTGNLAFANLEDVAKLNTLVTDLKDLPTRYATLELLHEQVNYFSYVDSHLLWLNYEGRLLSERVKENPHQEPAQRERPALCILED